MIVLSWNVSHGWVFSLRQFDLYLFRNCNRFNAMKYWSLRRILDLCRSIGPANCEAVTIVPEIADFWRFPFVAIYVITTIVTKQKPAPDQKKLAGNGAASPDKNIASTLCTTGYDQLATFQNKLIPEKGIYCAASIKDYKTDRTREIRLENGSG